jgi:hypothetical protein
MLTCRIMKSLLFGKNELLILLDLARYYKRCIEGFSKIVGPLSQIQRKGEILFWSSLTKERFQLFRKFLATKYVFIIQDIVKEFLMCIDDCHELISGLLMQEE